MVISLSNPPNPEPDIPQVSIVPTLRVGMLPGLLLRPDLQSRRVAGATKTGGNAGALAP